MRELSDYSIFDALQNSAEAYFNEDEEELERLITLFLEDEIAEGGLIDDKIIDTILNANKEKEKEPMADKIEIAPVLKKVSPVEAKKAIYKIIRFLYEQEVEFGK
ncbi:9908_t:CDS:2, partial [Funneliformis mosseae]